MEHLHEEPDPLDIDKPGYYFPNKVELFEGMEVETFYGVWQPLVLTFEMEVDTIYNPTLLRVRYLQAKDITDLGFGRMSRGMPMYIRGSYSIVATRLFDPTYSKLRITQHGVTVWEGMCKNKSELRRTLILNEINFADSN